MRPVRARRPAVPLRLRAVPLLVAAAFLAGCGAPAPKDEAPFGRAATALLLTKQADTWDKAIVAKDSVAIVSNMADDFRQIDGSGDMHAKRAFVADLLSPDLVIDPYTVEDFDVRLYGEVALLCGRTRMTGRYRGQPFASHYRYTDTYVRHAGGWKIASVQITRIAPAEPTP